MYRAMFFIIFSIFFMGCGDSDDSSSSSSSSSSSLVSITPSCFTAYVSNPVLSSGDLFTGSTWNDPSVLYRDNQYIMYASSDISFNGDIKIYRLVSSDGISWSLSPSSAVLEKGTSGSWDDKSVETPSVVYYNNQYYMFYTGYQTNTTTDFKIGYATSSDGVTWSKYASNPLITPSGTVTDFDGSAVAEPGALVYNSEIYLYFTGIGYNSTVADTLSVIGLKTFDGTTWSNTQSVLVPDQSIYPRGDNVSGYYGYSTPSAIEYNSKVHLFVDVAQYVSSSWTQVKLHHASSDDGKTSWSQDNEAIHSRSDFDWTTNEIRSVNPIYANDTFRIYYAGHKDTTLAIGYSTCN